MKSDLATYYQSLTKSEYNLAGRILILIWLVKVLMFSPGLASTYPMELIIPTGVLTLFNDNFVKGIFSFHGLMSIKIILISTLVLWFCKINSKWAGILPVLLLLVYSNVNHSFGSFLNHAEVAIFVALFIFSGTNFLRDESDCTNRRCIHVFYFFSMSAIVLVICYSLIGIYRLIYGGIDILISDYMLLTVTERSLERINSTHVIGLSLIKYSWFVHMLKAGFCLTTLLEILSPLVFYSKKFRYAWLVVMIPFHVSTLFLMNIFFWENILLLVLLFTGILKVCAKMKVLLK